VTDFDDLDTYNGKIVGGDGIHYQAEGHHVADIVSDRFTDGEFVVTDGGFEETCRNNHDWDTVPEGADGTRLCWNCNAVKIPVEVLVEDP